jgi:hypothetical protein
MARELTVIPSGSISVNPPAIIYLEDIHRTTLYHVLLLMISSIEAVPRISSGSQRDFRRLINPEPPTAHAIALYMIAESHDSDDK